MRHFVAPNKRVVDPNKRVAALKKRAALLVLAVACAATSSGEMRATLDWPEPCIAPDVRLSSVGEHIDINGVPARIYRYTTDLKPEEVIQYFRAHVERNFARAAASSSLPGQTAVGGRVGDFWVSLQLQQRGGETVGTWSAVPQFVPNARHPVQRPAGFPESATLIQQVDSVDEDKRSELAVGVDPGAVDGVAQRLEEELRDQGFIKQVTPQRSWPAPSVYAATFRRSRDELMVTLSQEPTGTSVVINRISALEQFK